MSTRQAGNRRENRFGALLEARGYAPFYSRGSRGVDILAVCRRGERHHLLIAVSRPSHTSVREPFEKLRSSPSIAGASAILAREVRPNKWRVYISEGSFFDDLDIALEAIRCL